MSGPIVRSYGVPNWDEIFGGDKPKESKKATKSAGKPTGKKATSADSKSVGKKASGKKKIAKKK